MSMSQILKFWIIHHPSGICIFEQTFETLPGDVDDQVVTGYLYAITNLSREIAHQNVDYIQLAKIRFLYFQANHFIMVMVTENDFLPEQGKILLNKLHTRFQTDYSEYFDNGFNFDVSPFGSFAETVELTLNTKAKYSQFLDVQASKLQSIIEQSKLKWSQIHDTITDHVKSAGEWTCNLSNTLNSKLKDKISSGRKHQVEIKDQNEKKTQKNNWV